MTEAAVAPVPAAGAGTSGAGAVSAAGGGSASRGSGAISASGGPGAVSASGGAGAGTSGGGSASGDAGAATSGGGSASGDAGAATSGAVSASGGPGTATSGGGVRGRRVVVAGATSESGAATCTALVAAGAVVVAVGSSAERLAALAERVPGISTAVCDLADPEAVTALARSTGAVDGLVHLVGGWVGGSGITGQTDEGWASMERSFRTLRNTVRAFYPALVASPSGRVAFVSSVSVDAPTASGADYTAAKAASESWMRSLADAFAAEAGPADKTGHGDETGHADRADRGGRPEGLRAAAVVFAVKALVDERMRASSPERRFPGFTDVATLADAVVALWDSPAAALNGTRRALT
jgi:NAD(P)-dependent dehydrogenase (short-subunit alcohol dehydrogenase family)